MVRVLVISLLAVFPWSYAVQSSQFYQEIVENYKGPSCDRLVTKCNPSDSGCSFETTVVSGPCPVASPTTGPLKETTSDTATARTTAVYDLASEDSTTHEGVANTQDPDNVATMGRSKRAKGPINRRCRDNPKLMKAYSKLTDKNGDCAKDLVKVGNICRFQDPLIAKLLALKIDEIEFREQLFARYHNTSVEESETTASPTKSSSSAGTFSNLIKKKTSPTILPPRFEAVRNNCPEGFVNDAGTCVDGDPNARRFLSGEISRTEFLLLARDQWTDENCVIHRPTARKEDDRP